MNHWKNLSLVERSWPSLLGKMKPSVLLFENCFVVLVFLFVWAVDEITCCDTKWIRSVYMMACAGKKRRSLIDPALEDHWEDLPSNSLQRFNHFNEDHPHNVTSLRAWLENERRERRKSEYLQNILLFSNFENKPTFQPSSLFIRRLLPQAKPPTNLGIQGFPEQWNIEEIGLRRSNTYRRTLDLLLEECCKTPKPKSCNHKLFVEAC